MKNICTLLAIAIGSLVFTEGNSQTVNTVQPTVMVIPFTKEGEDIRTVLDNNADLRTALTSVKGAFDKRGFTTVDFLTKLKAAKDMNVFATDNQKDIKSQLLQFAAPDVFVTVDAGNGLIKSTDGNKGRISLSANETSTGNSLSNINCESPFFFTDDFGALINKALSNCQETFLNTMQSKFTDIVNNGKSVIVQFGIGSGNSTLNFSTEMGGLPFSDKIDEWMQAHAYKNYAHSSGSTDKLVIYDEVRIPLKDNGKNYDSKKFALEIYQFLKTLDPKITVSKDIKGNTILIIIK